MILGFFICTLSVDFSRYMHLLMYSTCSPVSPCTSCRAVAIQVPIPIVRQEEATKASSSTRQFVVQADAVAWRPETSARMHVRGAAHLEGCGWAAAPFPLLLKSRDPHQRPGSGPPPGHATQGWARGAPAPPHATQPVER